MASITRFVEINAAIDRVFAFVSDSRNLPQWLSSIRAVVLPVTGAVTGGSDNLNTRARWQLSSNAAAAAHHLANPVDDFRRNNIISSDNKADDASLNQTPMLQQYVETECVEFNPPLRITWRVGNGSGGDDDAANDVSLALHLRETRHNTTLLEITFADKTDMPAPLLMQLLDVPFNVTPDSFAANAGANLDSFAQHLEQLIEEQSTSSAQTSDLDLKATPPTTTNNGYNAANLASISLPIKTNGEAFQIVEHSAKDDDDDEPLQLQDLMRDEVARQYMSERDEQIARVHQAYTQNTAPNAINETAASFSRSSELLPERGVFGDLPHESLSPITNAPPQTSSVTQVSSSPQTSANVFTDAAHYDSRVAPQTFYASMATAAGAAAVTTTTTAATTTTTAADNEPSIDETLSQARPSFIQTVTNADAFNAKNSEEDDPDATIVQHESAGYIQRTASPTVVVEHERVFGAPLNRQRLLHNERTQQNHADEASAYAAGYHKPPHRLPLPVLFGIGLIALMLGLGTIYYARYLRGGTNNAAATTAAVVTSNANTVTENPVSTNSVNQNANSATLNGTAQTNAIVTSPRSNNRNITANRSASATRTEDVAVLRSSTLR